MLFKAAACTFLLNRKIYEGIFAFMMQSFTVLPTCCYEVHLLSFNIVLSFFFIPSMMTIRNRKAKNIKKSFSYLDGCSRCSNDVSLERFQAFFTSESCRLNKDSIFA